MARAVRAGAKSAADLVLFDYLYEQRKAMRTAARGGERDADEVAHNMARIYDLVLEHGRFFEPSPRPKKYKWGDRNQCYGNALDLVIAHDELSYCEGYVVIERIPVPMEHGWCVTDEGTVVDVTLRKPVIALAYFGVVFNSLFAATRDLPAMESVLIENAGPAIWRAAS
ncbi:MAG: hypothetical protein JWL69_1280 [Phycisphaerales bacterium]|nr:hypothetical protein [Phycisphaerales bacterium]